MSTELEHVETVRRRFLPDRMTTLFVGESAPFSGDFFYRGNTPMLQFVRKALAETLGAGQDDFLEKFVAAGWYLDDLVLVPVNTMANAERKASCLASKDSLAARIGEYRPSAIVALMLGIGDIVKAATADAGSHADVHVVHFPGSGQQGKFAFDMAAIADGLPRSTPCPQISRSGG